MGEQSQTEPPAPPPQTSPMNIPQGSTKHGQRVTESKGVRSIAIQWLQLIAMELPNVAAYACQDVHAWSTCDLRMAKLDLTCPTVM